MGVKFGRSEGERTRERQAPEFVVGLGRAVGPQRKPLVEDRTKGVEIGADVRVLDPGDDLGRLVEGLR